MVFSLILLACKGADPEPGLEANFGVIADRGVEGCDNLVDTSCIYPFPSAAFLGSEGQVSLPEAGMARSVTGIFDPAPFERFIGFGAASPILLQLPGAVPDTSGVFDVARSLEPGSDTLLLDASTGERIPHWVESDFLSPFLDPPLIVIRPARALPRSTSVIVALRNQKATDGTLAPTPEAFAQIRDQQASTWIGVHERRATYEDVIFPALEAEGWDRSSVQLAWSFPVRSDADATERMVSVRDAVLGALPSAGPAYTLDRVLDCRVEAHGDCHPDLAVIVDGTIDVPSVVEPPDALGVRVLRWNGAAQVSGVERWPFRLQIPRVAYEGTAPVPVLQYGHGFLGSGREANNSWLRELAERQGMAILSTSLQGMNQDDSTTWLSVLLADGGRFPDLADLAMQGVADQLALQRLVKTSLAADPNPVFLREDGQLAWDPETVWYHGNSQGGSVGTVMMGLSQDVLRGDLGVPGSGYPLLLHRSLVFEPFADLLAGAYPDVDSIPRFLMLLGTGWDDFDPLTFAPHLHDDPLPGTPSHDVLLHVAKEDQQVHNEASFILGRTAGATLMIPAVRPVVGLPEQGYPASPGVALVEVDFNIPDDPTPLTPPEPRPELPNDGDTHGWLRRWQPAQDQMVHFFETGEMIDVCGGQACFNDGAP